MEWRRSWYMSNTAKSKYIINRNQQKKTTTNKQENFRSKFVGLKVRTWLCWTFAVTVTWDDRRNYGVIKKLRNGTGALRWKTNEANVNKSRGTAPQKLFSTISSKIFTFENCASVAQQFKLTHTQFRVRVHDMRTVKRRIRNNVRMSVKKNGIRMHNTRYNRLIKCACHATGLDCAIGRYTAI